MVVSLNAASAKVNAKAVKANTRKFSNLADFTKAGQEIAEGVGEYKELMQTATLAAMKHLDTHGNFNIIKPLWSAAMTFSKGEGRKWQDYLVTYTHLSYNPKGLRGNALTEAKFEDLWAKDKSKKMDIDGASKKAWDEHSKARSSSTEPVNLVKQVATYMRGLNDLLKANRLVVPTADGKGIKRKATAADVRAELRSQLEEIVVTLKVVPGVGTRNPSTVQDRSPMTATPVRNAKAAPVTARKARTAKAA